MTAVERHALIDELSGQGLSRQAACRWAGYSRAVGRYELRRPAQDAERLEAMRKAVKANPRYGYRRIAVVSDDPSLTLWTGSRPHYRTGHAILRYLLDMVSLHPAPEHTGCCHFDFAQLSLSKCSMTLRAEPSGRSLAAHPLYLAI